MATTDDDIADAVADGVQPLIDRLLTLERRLAEVEARGLKYCGVFQRAATYPRGSVVSEGGRAWVALRAVDGEQPGKSDGWQLFVKAGRDGRNA